MKRKGNSIHGMVWHGNESYEMERHDMEWKGKAMKGMVWYDITRKGNTWHGK
jgi:hypothetical protein